MHLAEELKNTVTLIIFYKLIWSYKCIFKTSHGPLFFFSLSLSFYIMLNIIYKSVDWSMRQAEQSHCFFTKGTALPAPPPAVAMEMPPNPEPRKCREGGNGSEPSFQLSLKRTARHKYTQHDSNEWGRYLQAYISTLSLLSLVSSHSQTHAQKHC